MCGSFGKHAAHDVHAVVACAERHGGLVTVFGGQRVHARLRDVGRVGDDDVERAALQVFKEVALNELERLLHAVVAAVDFGDLERVGREVGARHFGVREGALGENREAARTRAEVEHAVHFIRILDPGGKVLLKKLGNVGARNQRTLVDVEAVLGEPGLAQQVGGRNLFVDAAVDEVHESGELVVRERGVKEHVEVVERKLEAAADEEGGFLPAVGRAVAVGDFGVFHFRDRPTEDVADGLQIVNGVIKQRSNFVHGGIQ